MLLHWSRTTFATCVGTLIFCDSLYHAFHLQNSTLFYMHLIQTDQYTKKGRLTAKHPFCIRLYDNVPFIQALPEDDNKETFPANYTKILEKM